jgi:hypothetical protein
MTQLAVNPNYVDFKKEVLNKRIGRKCVSLSDIRVISDTLVEVNTVKLLLTKDAFKNLMKIVGITDNMRSNLISQYGDVFTDKLVTTLGKAMSHSKGAVVLVIDLKKKTIINIVQGVNHMIPNDTYLDNVERIINDSDLKIDSMVFRDNGGFTISTLGDSSQWGIRGAENNESFKFGLNFDNDPITGTRLMPFNQRLICSNGMIGQGFVGVHQLTNTQDSWEQFMFKVETLKRDNFKPIEFSATLKAITNTNASVSELLAVRNLIKSNSKIEEEHLLERFVPIECTESAYNKKGIWLDSMTTAQQKNAISDVSYWGLINGLTDFASHDYGLNVKNPDVLQRYAGKMFVKNPDLTNLVMNPF